MKKKPTLVILAAGLGSRYQGLKQMDTFGPAGESLLDYTVFDAITDGFAKIVFVIREGMRDVFIPEMKKKLDGKVESAFVFQELDALPEGCIPNPERIKPWGTGHALWMARTEVDGAFAMVNADDFYGRDALSDMVGLLQAMDSDRDAGCMVGYQLENTLSEFGSVSRGVCTLELGNLKSITERTKISKVGDEIYFEDEGDEIPISGTDIVSMNLMGFSQSVFKLIESEFIAFYTRSSSDLKAEFYVPSILQKLIELGVQIPVPVTESTWFGVTYPEDKVMVQNKLTDLITKKVYPPNLWGS